MKKIYREIIKKYDREVLTPQLGDGALKEKLLEGLECVIHGVEVESNKGGRSMRDLDVPIYFNELEELAEAMGGRALATRAMNRFELRDIRTYKDLAEDYRKHFEDYRTCASPEEYFLKWKGMGRKTVRLLLTHLERVGFGFPERRPEFSDI